MIRSAAAGVGNVVVLFGASTGRDGIGGASVLASAEFGEADGDKRPSVQVGDPFAEKKLMECSLELLDRGLLVALQDLGAAGLTSSSAEMASKGGVGHRPRRRAHAAARGRHGALRDHGLRVPGADAVRLRARARWRTCSRCARAGRSHGTAIGEVTDTGAMRIFRGDELVGDMPVAALVDDCPVYDARARSARRADLRRRPWRPWRTGGSVARGAAGAARLAQPRLAPAAVRAVRLDRAVAHRAPPGGGRRRRARAARRRRARRWRIDGNGRRVAADPYHGHDRGDARVRGQPRVRRRRAARA